MPVSTTFQYSTKGKQGPQGLSTRTGNAPPAANAGVDGDTFSDVTNLTLYAARSGGVWPSSSVSLRGATGDQGTGGAPTYTMPSSCITFGPFQCFASSQTLSGTPVTIPVSGANGLIPYYAPTVASDFRGASFIITSGTASATFRLVDLNNPGTAILNYGPYAAGTINTVTASAGAVSLPAGGRYAWQVSGSGGQAISVVPQYSRPSSQPFGVSVLPSMSITTAVTLSATAQNMRAPSSTTHTPRYGFITPAYLYQATFTYGATSVTFQLFNETTSAVVYTSPTFSGGGEITVGPFGPSSVKLVSGNNYYWRVLGSGSFTGNVNALVVQ